MKTVLGCVRKADTDFEMIAPGDRIAVGISGGKDSLLLLYALSLYRKFSGKDFTLHAITLKMGLEPFDVSPIAALCEKIDVPYTVIETEIAHGVHPVKVFFRGAIKVGQYVNRSKRSVRFVARLPRIFGEAIAQVFARVVPRKVDVFELYSVYGVDVAFV